MTSVLVTGAGGFIGSHLTERLARDGHAVRAFVRYNSSNSWGWLERSEAASKVELVRGDLTDPFAVIKAVQGVEVVFHLGAAISIPYSYVHPREYVQVNVVGTSNILDAALAAGVKRVVHASTSEVYGTAKYTPIDEDHPLQAQSPYSASKIAADKMAESYFRSFGLDVVVVRPFNTFGPRQSARAVIPTIISQALASGEVRLGNLTPVRDLTFVTDTVDGFVKVGFCEKAKGQAINLGTGRGISVRELVGIVQGIVGRSLKIVEDPQRVRPDTSEVFQLVASNKRAREVAGWAPSRTLEEGLRETVSWIRAHLDLYKTGAYTV